MPVEGWWLNLNLVQGEPLNVFGSHYCRCYAEDVSDRVFPKDQFDVFPITWEVTASMNMLLVRALNGDLFEEASIPARIYTIRDYSDDMYQAFSVI